MAAFFKSLILSFTYALLLLLTLGALYLLTSPTGIGSLSEIGTLITALATLVLAIVTTLLWTVSAAASEASKRSADAATMSNKILEDTAERQLRAYVITTQASLLNDATGQFESFVAPNATAVFAVRFENNGQTPAKGLRVRSQFSLRPAGSETQYGFDIDETTHNSETTLGSGGAATTLCRSDRPLSLKEYQDILSGRTSAVCMGEITYVDVFNRQRITRFSYHNAAGVNDGSCNFLPAGNTMD